MAMNEQHGRMRPGARLFWTIGIAGLGMLAGGCSRQDETTTQQPATTVANQSAAGDPNSAAVQASANALAPLPGVIRAADAVKDGPYRVAFWIKEDRTDENIPDRHDHPCGSTADLRVDAIPDFSAKDALETAEAVEYDAQGKTIAKWRVPVDSTLAGLDGDALLIQISDSASPDQYWINRAGQISRPAKRFEGAPPAYMTCPKSIAEGTSCHEVVDPADRRVRRISIDGICS